MSSEKPHTVVFIESAASMGGVQFSTLYAARNLGPTHWKPIVLCPEQGDLTKACGEFGIDIHVFGQHPLRSTSLRVGRKLRLPNPLAWGWNLYTLHGASRRLAHLLKMNPAALVVTKGLSAHFAGGMAAHRLGLPCVWHVQDFISERSFGIYKRAFGLAARWLPDQIIVDGAAIKQQLPPELRAPISVVHNGVDTNVFSPEVNGRAIRQEFGIPKDHLVVGHAGRVTPWKGQHYLIEAFAAIAATHPNVTLMLVGSPVFDTDTYERRLRSLVSQYNLKDRVVFTGYRQDLPEVLAAMDVFAFTSIEKDTSPLALLSAMSSGLPIVAFDIAGVQELVAQDPQFLIVPVEDTARLGQALGKLLNDADLRKRLGAAARRHAVAEFSLEKYTAQIEDVCWKAIASRERAGKHVAANAGAAASSAAELRDCA